MNQSSLTALGHKFSSNSITLKISQCVKALGKSETSVGRCKTSPSNLIGLIPPTSVESQNNRLLWKLFSLLESKTALDPHLDIIDVVEV